MNRKDIKPTSSLSYGDTDVVHDVYDGTDCFLHRLRFDGQRKFVGEWVPYSQFAHLSFHCPDCNKLHVYRACQDSWQPMFPPVFMINTPHDEDIPLVQREIFEQFYNYEVSEG